MWKSKGYIKWKATVTEVNYTYLDRKVVYLFKGVKYTAPAREKTVWNDILVDISDRFTESY